MSVATLSLKEVTMGTHVARAPRVRTMSRREERRIMREGRRKEGNRGIIAQGVDLTSYKGDEARDLNQTVPMRVSG